MSNKLICFAISRAAMRWLIPEHCGSIPDTWFNWTGAQLPGLDFNARRLTLAETDGKPWTEADIVRFDRACYSLGYDAALVVAEGDPVSVYRLVYPGEPDRSVQSEFGTLLVFDSPSQPKFREELLTELQSSDPDLWLAFADARGGGGTDLGKLGYGNLTPFHWWTLAQEFENWVTIVGKPENANLHPRAYPLKDWGVYSRGVKDAPIQDTVFSIEEFFKTAYSNQLEAVKDYDGPDKAWSESNVSDFKGWTFNGQALRAVYPMRSLPFCGVAETLDGELKPYGGFASLEDPWAWDADSEIRNALKEWQMKRDAVTV